MEIDFTKIKSKQDLIIKIKQDFDFPDYCENNWDAVEECLNDYCKKNIKINIKNIEKIEDSLKNDFIIFLQVISYYNLEHKNKTILLVNEPPII